MSHVNRRAPVSGLAILEGKITIVVETTRHVTTGEAGALLPSGSDFRGDAARWYRKSGVGRIQKRPNHRSRRFSVWLLAAGSDRDLVIQDRSSRETSLSSYAPAARFSLDSSGGRGHFVARMVAVQKRAFLVGSA